jgi:hypothetical protein
MTDNVIWSVDFRARREREAAELEMAELEMAIAAATGSVTTPAELNMDEPA